MKILSIMRNIKLDINSFFGILLLGIYGCAPKIPMQEIKESSYNIELVTASRFEGNPNNNLTVVFLVTPKNTDDFPPILSMGLRYFVEDNKEVNYVDLQNQKGSGRVNLTILGKDIAQKSPKIYSLIKNKINLESYKDLQILAFEFKDKIDLNVKSMNIIYGLWEKKNPNQRLEKRYDFKIETFGEAGQN